MRKGLVVFTLCLIFCTLSFSPFLIRVAAQFLPLDLSLGDSDYIWNFKYGANDSWDAAYSIISTEDGGFVLVGVTGGDGDDVLIVRLNEFGEIQWISVPPGSEHEFAHEVIECETGGYAIIGYSEPQEASGSDGHSDVYMMRINDDGSTLWTRTYELNDIQQAYSIVECSDGGFAFTGYTTNITGEDVWLVRTTSDGQPIWNKTYGDSGNQTAYSLVETHHGGFMLAGYTIPPISFATEGWVICTDSSGAMLWNHTYTGGEPNNCEKVIRGSQTEYIVTGTSNNWIYGGWEGFLLSFTINGTMSWNTTIGSANEDRVYSITSCGDGGYALTGYTIEETQFGEKTHLWLARVDSSGNELWQKRYGGHGQEIGWEILQATNGDFVIVGTTELELNSHTEGDVLLIRVPDGATLNPNYELIALGVVSGSIILVGILLLYLRSRREIST